MKRIFLTGATGFVGRYVGKALLDAGYDVWAAVRDLDRLKSLFDGRISGIRVDLSDTSSIRRAFERVKPEGVIHLVGILYERKGETFDLVHHTFTSNLVKVSQDFGVEKFVFMSALGTHDLAPSRYHRSKRSAEKEVKFSKMKWTIFRPSLILGPEQKLFSDFYRMTRFLPVVPTPDVLFQPVDVRDVACAFVKALQKDETNGRIYELCGDKVVSFRDILKDVFSAWRRRVLLIPSPKPLMYLAGSVLEKVIYPPPLTADQVRMMWKPNVCGAMGDEALSDGVRAVCGKDPIPYEESLKWSLKGFSDLMNRR